MSAVLPAALALVVLSDLLAGHEDLDRVLLTWHLVSLAVSVLIPLCVGRRYPRWAGAVTLAFIETWSTYLMLNSTHAHAEINALLHQPFVALYLGWFFQSRVGTTLMAVGVGRLLVVLWVNPDMGKGVVDPNLIVAYAILVSLFCFFGARLVRRQLQRHAETDSLTQALNRRGLAALEQNVRRRAERAGEPVSVAMIDFDDFKRLNDLGGHAAGDAALSSAVQLWRAMAAVRGSSGRSGGLVARLGGDEFAVVLRTDAATADRLLRETRAASDAAWSWGISEALPGEPLEMALSRADATLIRIKVARGQGPAASR
ncbi:GGDEF domain-containing protein [Leucobacter sp. USHLN153]|uniref:GGDEF domain-containing protein n=1 Tax=Leucobacter sp. USHLN153 TaxID=3081268 RepID=UPI003015D90F